MTLLTVTQACHTVLAHAPQPVAETTELDCAAGRILLEPVYADRDYPPIDRATMDGIAINAASWSSGVRAWRIEGTVPAGMAARSLHDPANGCVKIMTGGEVPAGCDGILPFEQVDIEGDTAVAHLDAVFQDRQFIHDHASDRRKGDLLLAPGQHLDAPRLAILAAVGHHRIRTARLPRVAVITTGNEIVPIHTSTPAPVQSRASNAAGLAAALHGLGIATPTMVHLPDDLEATVEAIGRTLADHDLVLLSGGVSKRTYYDYVPAALERNGVARIFHGIAQKPGKPLWFGIRDPVRVFGLPGNPVSTLTVFRRYVVPFIRASTGAQPAKPRLVNLVRPIKPHDTLTLFPPVRLCGQQTVEAVEYHGSGDFAALAESDGFVEIPPGSTESTEVPFRAW